MSATCFALFSGAPYRSSYGTWQWPRAECIQNNSCGLSHQSPINIETYGVVFDQRMPPLVFSGYEDNLLDFNVTSDGYTVTVEPGPKDPVRTVKGGALPGVFVFSRIQFHWGSTSSQGSEHRIDGLTYAMESHIIHTNQKYVPAEASYYSDGLAILATLYRVSHRGGPGGRAMAAILSRLSDGRKKRLLSRLSRLLFFSSQQHFPPAHTRLSGFLSPNTSAFYTYRGSLTMPPCSEAVTWTVFDRLLDVGEEQLKSLRERPGRKKGRKLVDNFRPPQRLNDRKVYASFLP